MMKTNRRKFLSKALAAGIGAQFALKGITNGTDRPHEQNQGIKPLPSLQERREIGRAHV